MASPFHLVVIGGILAFIIIAGGCVSLNVGDVVYSGNNLSIALENAGDTSDAFVQVTAYRLSGFSQEEYLVVSRPVTLEAGQNTVIIPAELPAGNYKLYIYVIQNGVRKTAVIRDIGV
jgi:hypothetical protein